jgi:DNA-binding response OmpR family regulator
MDKAVGRNMRIAALDDDALQLDLFKQALHAMGHTCHTYLTGAQLLHSLQSECFDLLIVDWHLPDTTGPEVVRWVRQHVGLEMPILFVTYRQE